MATPRRAVASWACRCLTRIGKTHPPSLHVQHTTPQNFCQEGSTHPFELRSPSGGREGERPRPRRPSPSPAARTSASPTASKPEEGEGRKRRGERFYRESDRFNGRDPQRRPTHDGEAAHTQQACVCPRRSDEPQRGAVGGERGGVRGHPTPRRVPRRAGVPLVAATIGGAQVRACNDKRGTKAAHASRHQRRRATVGSALQSARPCELAGAVPATQASLPPSPGGRRALRAPRRAPRRAKTRAAAPQRRELPPPSWRLLARSAARVSLHYRTGRRHRRRAMFLLIT